MYKLILYWYHYAFDNEKAWPANIGSVDTAFYVLYFQLFADADLNLSPNRKQPRVSDLTFSQSVLTSRAIATVIVMSLTSFKSTKIES